MHLTTKKKKDFFDRNILKNRNSFVFDINILQQRKKKDSFDRNI